MSHLKMLGATIKYFVTMVTWHTGFVQPQCEDTYIPCNVQFIYCNLEIYLGTQCATPFKKHNSAQEIVKSKKHKYNRTCSKHFKWGFHWLQRQYMTEL
jgi:hypothetical protein